MYVLVYACEWYKIKRQATRKNNGTQKINDKNTTSYTHMHYDYTMAANQEQQIMILTKYNVMFVLDDSKVFRL